MKVSVIMPSLNVAPYIEKCIYSVINQSLQDIEIICVDAGSTDGTLETVSYTHLDVYKRQTYNVSKTEFALVRTESRIQKKLGKQ